MRSVVLIVAGLSLAGCQSIMAAFTDPDSPAFEKLNQVVETGEELEEESYKRLGQGVDLWCSNAPEPVRLRVREGVNSHAQKGEIAITCFED